MSHRSSPGTRCILIALLAVLAARSASASAAPPLPTAAVRRMIARGNYADAEVEARRLLSRAAVTRAPANSRAELLDLLVESLLNGEKEYDAETRVLVDSAVALQVSLRGKSDAGIATSLVHKAYLELDTSDNDSIARENIERAVVLIERSAAPGRLVLSNALFILGFTKLRAGDNAAARATFERARDLASGKGLAAAVRRAEAVFGLAQVSSAEGNRQAARALLEQEVARATKELGGDHPVTLQATYSLSVLLVGATDRARRLELLRQVVAGMERRLGRRYPTFIRALDQLGVTYWRSGRLPEADSVLRRSVALGESLTGARRTYLAFGFNMLGNVLEARGRLAEAREALLRSLDLYQTYASANPYYMALVFNDLANVEQERDEFATAQSLYDRALALAEHSSQIPPNYFALYLTNAGWMRSTLGDFAGARRHLERAVAMFDSISSPAANWRSRALAMLGRCLMAEGETTRGLRHLERSLEVARSYFAPDDPQLAASELDLAYACTALPGDSATRVHLDRARAILASRNSGADIHVGCDFLDAWLWERQGRPVAAESLYRRAIAGSERERGTNAQMGANLAELARTLRKQGRLAEAESVAVRGASLFEVGRKRVPDGVERATFVHTQGSPYYELTAIRLARGAGDAAWEAAESDLGRSLADLIASTGNNLLDPVEAAKQDSLGRRLDEIEQLCDRLGSVADVDTSTRSRAERSEARRELQDVSAAWSALQLDLSRRHPVSEGHPLSLDRVRAALGPETALIGWFDFGDPDGHRESWGYVVRSSDPVFWARLDAEGGDAYEVAAGFRRELWNSRYLSRRAEHFAPEIWKMRIQPLLPALRGKKRLVAINTGVMAGIPIEAARDDKGRLLGERFTVSYSPSATIFAVLSERGDSTGRIDPRRALVVGDPTFSPRTSTAVAVAQLGSSASRGITDTTLYRSALGGDPETVESLSPLPGTRLEAQAIARLSGNALLLLGDEATEERLSTLARSASLDSFGTLHFATHALADDQRPWRSSLLLSHVAPADGYEAARTGGRIFDGRITAGEILREWKLHAHLVTLSACQTGMGRDLGGEGIVGLAHTFLQAGAQSVLASLWAVDDRATSLLMQRFYEEWWGSAQPNERGRTPVSKSEALRRAKQWLRSMPEYDRPFYWAAFVLIGNPS